MMSAVVIPGNTARPLQTRWHRLALGAAIVVGVALRLSVLLWNEPWTPHHADEHILPLEAVALWEGVTPREIGWPAATTRLAISVVAGATWLVDQGRDVWAHRSALDGVLDSISHWIALRYVDPTPLYQIGRGVSLATGILQLVATAWALGRWVGPAGTIVGTLLVALSPLATEYSQYVLADITGTLFATILVGLSARPTRFQIAIMGVLAGLAAASKFHFGIWLVTPLLCIWLRDDPPFEHRGRLTLGILAAAGLIVIALVPWFWLNPILALKEFAGVVAVKAGAGPTLQHVAVNASTILSGLVVIAVFGLVGAAVALRSSPRRAAAVAVPTIIGALALAASDIVFDRYGLVLLPGLVTLAGLGWDAVDAAPMGLRRAAVTGLVAAIVLTTVDLAAAQRRAGEADVDVLARRWIVEHVARGARVAIHQEDNAFLPRTSEQLRACINDTNSVKAYNDKWLIEGVVRRPDAPEPMRSVVLNDERFYEYWCRQELQAQRDPGFFIVPYHAAKRFGAVLEREAIDDFRTRATAVTGGIDVLVLNRPVDVGAPPAATLATRRGQRVIYRRVD